MDGIHSIPATGQFYKKPDASEVVRQQKQERSITLGLGTDYIETDPEAIQESRKDLAHLTPTLNQRLEFDYNRELDQVIVKIIDRDTDILIRELPAAESQRMHLAIREAIGQLIDKKV